MGTAITDWGTAVITSLATALAAVFSFIPRIIGFLVILLVAWIVASLVAKALTFLLRRVGFDRIATRIGLSRLEQSWNMRMDAAGLLGKIVFWFIFLIFMIPAIDSLGLASVSALLGQLIAYIPNVFVAIIILFLGMLVATFAADLIYRTTANANIGSPSLLANVARYAIIGFVALLALYQLQIAPAMIQTLFTAVIGAAALAFALAFGLGGRDAAKRYLDRSESSLRGAASAIQQSNADGEYGVQATPTQPVTDQNVNYGRAQTYPNQVRNPEQNPYKRPVNDR
ncbi:MAG TPA: hypothetical protein VKX46_17980 [Ktedonobacteraceae bacterium]|nr:hypothetical protein [Ktedonobacteraceae bacterium]